MRSVPADGQLAARWHPSAATLYRSWLVLISAEKRRQLRPTQYLAALRFDPAPAPVI